MTRTAIIAALPGELKPFVRGWQTESCNGIHLWRCQLDQHEWVAGCAGAGQAAATRAFAELERDGPIDQVVSAGWAGALSDEFTVGLAYWVRGVIDARTGERFAASEPVVATKSEEVLSHPSDRNKDVARVGHPGW